ncbi:unnamed protein product [Didymodactylos carnosus]|uniref:Uncharacterized protein n=1 Tax=Didymodactylos carnosus TaxID=1234261 RepID=A0A8S2SFX6_9BILA|nr:unnamed protein product [Didymodactylos carnosus]CAF4228752.1 unnamed protein product [Didymodactylos carnosus]
MSALDALVYFNHKLKSITFANGSTYGDLIDILGRTLKIDFTKLCIQLWDDTYKVYLDLDEEYFDEVKDLIHKSLSEKAFSISFRFIRRAFPCPLPKTPRAITRQPSADKTDEPVQENQSCTNSPVRMQFNSKQVNDGDIPTKADSGTILEQLVHMIHKSLMTHHNEQHTSTEIVTQQQRTDEVTVVRSEKEAKNFNIEEYNVDKHNKVSLKPLMNVTDSSMTMVDQQYHVTTLAPVDEERITVVRKK